MVDYSLAHPEDARQMAKDEARYKAGQRTLATTDCWRGGGSGVRRRKHARKKIEVPRQVFDHSVQ